MDQTWALIGTQLGFNGPNLSFLRTQLGLNGSHKLGFNTEGLKDLRKLNSEVMNVKASAQSIPSKYAQIQQ